MNYKRLAAWALVVAISSAMFYFIMWALHVIIVWWLRNGVTAACFYALLLTLTLIMICKIFKLWKA